MFLLKRTAESMPSIAKKEVLTMRIDVSRIPYDEVEKIVADACLEVSNIARVGKRIVLECADPLSLPGRPLMRRVG